MRHRPVFGPAPGLAGRHARLAFTPFAPINVPCSPQGACGTTGRKSRARGARMCWHAGSPHAAFAAHGQWPSPTPKIVELNRASEADLRLRSARGWILRLAASLTGNCRLRRPRPDRASCRAGMHSDRPPVASASISCPPANPRLSSVIRSIQARHRSGHRIPLPRFDDDRDAPLTGAGCDRRYKSYREDQEQNANKCRLFFLRIRKALSAATTPKVALAWGNDGGPVTLAEGASRRISIIDPDAHNVAHADGIGAGATEVDATATTEWTTVVDFRNNRLAVLKVGDRHHAAEGQRPVSNSVGIGRVGVEPVNGGGAAPVIAVPNSIV